MTGLGASPSHAPDFAVGSLAVWVHGREFPDSQDYWDGNWLEVTARVAAPGATVEASGTILQLREVARFLEQARALCERLDGEARLDCLEPNLGVVLRCSTLGHIAVTIAITPDHMTQRHEFREDIDQTFLPPIMRGLEEVLRRFPVRGGG